METQVVCLRSSDGTKTSAIAHFEYGLDAESVMLNASTRFTDASGEVLYNPADFEEITVGACPVDVQCVESQEWTYGIDNTGTRTDVDAILCITNSDGSTIEVLQSDQGALAQWTPQMAEWGTNLQAAVDAAGLKWFVETRFIEPPPSLAGGGGFPGPPSLPVAEALWKDGMRWRYLNIQICPGQPVPVRAIWKELDGPDGNVVREVDMTTAGAVLGPLQKFWMCAECGKEPVWYLEDGVTLAEAGQIPNCWEPCGTLALTDAPPDRECEFFFASACDNQNDPDPLSWIQDITRRTTVCNGEVLSVDYLSADPADPASLVPYELLGAFVDCASGEPIEDEIPTCRDYVSVGNLWKFRPQGEVGTLIEWWQDPDEGGNSAPHDSPSNIFSLVNGTYEHPNGAPTASYLSPTFSTSTASADFIEGMGIPDRNASNGTDQLKLSGYVNLPRAGVVSDTNGNTGERGLFAIQYCCQGDMVTIAERTTDSVAGDTGIFTNVGLPAGIHYVEIMTSDLSAWQGMEFSLSLDGGETNQPFISSTAKPYYECIPVLKCLDSGLLVNAETGEVVEVEFNDTWCEPECNSPVAQDAGDSAGPTAQEIADAMVTTERARTQGFRESWQNEGGTVSLNVAPGTIGCLRTITDYGAGAVYWNIEGLTPTATNSHLMSVQYGPNIDLCGIDLSLVRLSGSSTGSDFGVTYEVWS